MQRVENRAEWDQQLTEPFASRRRVVAHKPSKPSQAEIENEGADFMNFMGTMTG